ncbi:MAG: hypothetical protein R6W90_05150 [Ignavibacteriaceae bacterium]
MKTLFSILFLSVIFSYQSLAQEETLIGDGEISHGGFGGPVIKFTQIKDEFGVLVGGRGGWIINHQFVIGGGGYGLVNNIEANDFIFSPQPFITFGYGGFEMEYIIHSDRLIHFSVYSLIGGGAVTYRDELWDDWEDWDYGSDTFFVFEPAVNMELNIYSFFRLNAGISYRMVSGVDFDTLENSDLSGPSATLTLKFGKF